MKLVEPVGNAIVSGCVWACLALSVFAVPAAGWAQDHGAEALALCEAWIAESGATSVHAYDAEATLEGQGTLARELERVKGLPFASPSAFVLVQTHSPQARDMLVVAQDQHRQLLDAIEHHEGARAEAILREHSRLAQRNLRAALSAQAAGQGHAGLPALTLIRRR